MNLIHALWNDDLDEIQQLIEQGTWLNSQANHNETALMHAAKFNNTDAVKALLNAGADPNVNDKDNNTALDFGNYMDTMLIKYITIYNSAKISAENKMTNSLAKRIKNATNGCESKVPKKSTLDEIIKKQLAKINPNSDGPKDLERQAEKLKHELKYYPEYTKKFQNKLKKQLGKSGSKPEVSTILL